MKKLLAVAVAAMFLFAVAATNTGCQHHKNALGSKKLVHKPCGYGGLGIPQTTP